MNTPGLIPHATITTILDNVTQARADIAAAFALLDGAKTRLATVLGDGSGNAYGHLWTHAIHDADLPRTACEVDTQVATNTWRYLLRQLGLDAYMTETRQKELQTQLERGELPPLTVDNVLSTLQGLTSQVGTLLEESVREVFEWLRPYHHYGVGALKTNEKYRVGPKVILGYTVEAGYPTGLRLKYQRQRNLHALGNVLSLLDGQGVQRYPHDLVTQVQDALKDRHYGEVFTVPYLSGRGYKNGHLHVTFTRLDLIDRLNQIGGDGQGLPQERR